jgi:hypothetical protein
MVRLALVAVAMSLSVVAPASVPQTSTRVWLMRTSKWLSAPLTVPLVTQAPPVKFMGEATSPRVAVIWSMPIWVPWLTPHWLAMTNPKELRG